MTLSEELTWRGFVNQTTFKNLGDLDTENRTFYWGVDPSASSMTIGNFAAAMMAKTFMKHGWEAILLVGGATGMIGDPDGKKQERDLLSLDDIENNKKSISAQYSQVFSGLSFDVVDNYDWFKDFNYLQFLRDIGKHVPLTQMLDRSFVRDRVGEGGAGISYAEFSYSLIQGYDFLHLFKEKGATVQLCGADQWGNSIAGVELIRRVTSGEAHIYTCPLIVNKTTGVKFGKSEDGAIWLDANLTSPYKFYQFWLNVDDEGVGDYIKVYTEIQKDEFDQLMAEFNQNRAERTAQKYLAYEVTKLVHGQDVADSVKRISEVLFSGRDVSDLVDQDFAALSLELPTSQNEDILEFLIETKIASSKGEARRLIEQNAVSVNGEKVTSLDAKLKSPSLIKKGKNVFAVKN
jgi:tyrosyl-tRNA synthetase